MNYRVANKFDNVIRSDHFHVDDKRVYVIRSKEFLLSHDQTIVYRFDFPINNFKASRKSLFATTDNGFFYINKIEFKCDFTPLSGYYLFDINFLNEQIIMRKPGQSDVYMFTELNGLNELGNAEIICENAGSYFIDKYIYVKRINEVKLFEVSQLRFLSSIEFQLPLNLNNFESKKNRLEKSIGIFKQKMIFPLESNHILIYEIDSKEYEVVINNLDPDWDGFANVKNAKIVDGSIVGFGMGSYYSYDIVTRKLTFKNLSEKLAAYNLRNAELSFLYNNNMYLVDIVDHGVGVLDMDTMEIIWHYKENGKRPLKIQASEKYMGVYYGDRTLTVFERDF